MVQALTTLPEDLDSIPSTHLEAHSQLHETLVPCDLTPSPGLPQALHTCSAWTYKQRKHPHTYKIICFQELSLWVGGTLESWLSLDHLLLMQMMGFPTSSPDGILQTPGISVLFCFVLLGE